MSLLGRIPGTKAWRMRRHAQLCIEAYERIQVIVDGELPSDRHTRVLIRHLSECGSCAGQAASFKQLKIAIARASEDADPKTVEKLNELARRLCSGQHEA